MGRRGITGVLQQRTSGPGSSAIDKQRAAQIDWFTDPCRRRDLSTVIEVGAGAGRDGLLLEAKGLAYAGVDLSETGVDICRGRGLNATVAAATKLPFQDASFDAGWTMSTLMHLPDEGFAVALDELHRLLRPGALLAVGLWGSTYPRTRVDEHGRLFQQHTDDQVRGLLSGIGDLVRFETWSWFDDGGHYQCAVVVIG